MKYGNLTLGQIEAGINIVGGEDCWRKLLAGELKVVSADKKESDFLTHAGIYPAVRVTKQFDPQKFYQRRKGLCAWPSFVNQVVAVAEPTGIGNKFQEAPYWKLKELVTGEMLRQVHPKNVWSATDFCAWLSTMLAKQSKGQSGVFLNNEKANLFLVEGVDQNVFVVNVCWNSGARGWDVDTWDLSSEWRAGRRFFSKPPIVL